MTDNGRAFEAAILSNGGGIGLSSMRERAERLDGSLTILAKLHLANRTQAALYALREGLAKLDS